MSHVCSTDVRKVRRFQQHLSVTYLHAVDSLALRPKPHGANRCETCALLCTAVIVIELLGGEVGE